MGKLTAFLITLANPQAVYYSGQFIDGHVIVDLAEEMKMRGIRVQFGGGASVRFRDRVRKPHTNEREMETFTAHESYFDHLVVIAGKAPGQPGDDLVLPPGKYVYPFRFQLPVGLPSSFESDMGRVRYNFCGVIDRPWKFDHTCKGAFTVIDPLDLNVEPIAMQPQEVSDNKTLGCCCCQSAPISAVLRLGRLGYVPGEGIAIYGEINNGSSKVMKSSFAELIMITTYHGRHHGHRKHHKTQHTSLGKIVHGSIPAGGNDIWNGELLQVPPIPPTGLRGCNIIEIVYTVSLNVDPPGISFDLSVPVNILIGTIPLMSTMVQYGLAPPLPPPGNVDVQPSANFMPPPSYAASVLGEVNIREDTDNEHTRGTLDYTPVYSFYNFNEEKKTAENKTADETIKINVKSVE